MESVKSSNSSFKESYFYSYRKAMPKKYLEPINTINQFTKEQLDDNIQNLKTKERNEKISDFAVTTILCAIFILGAIVMFSSLGLAPLNLKFDILAMKITTFVVMFLGAGICVYSGFVLFCYLSSSQDFNDRICFLESKIKCYENRLFFKNVIDEFRIKNSIKSENLKKLKEIWQYSGETESTKKTAKKIAEYLIFYNYLLENMGKNLKNFLETIQELTSENILKKVESNAEQYMQIVKIFKKNLIKNENSLSLNKNVSKNQQNPSQVFEQLFVKMSRKWVLEILKGLYKIGNKNNDENIRQVKIYIDNLKNEFTACIQNNLQVT